MTDPNFYIAMAAATLVGLAMLTVAGLIGWRGWLELQGRLLTRPGEASGIPSAVRRADRDRPT